MTLDRRIADRLMLTNEIAAWETSRNRGQCKVHWQFTTADARTKLRRLYPVIEAVKTGLRKEHNDWLVLDMIRTPLPNSREKKRAA